MSIAEKRKLDISWWQDGKFGLFIHWGPSSVAGEEIGWSRMSHPHDHPWHPTVPDAEYDALYKKFNPVDFDADFIVQTAKQAGMKYLVFTTKHHDGFANWPTRLSDYNISNTPFKRDICRELADAVRRHGLRLGWYYSTRDWYHPDYLVGDNSKYNDFYHGQIRELLTVYGKVDLLWFDHVAGTWADYRFGELFEMIYALQPGILVNNRAARFVFPLTAGIPDPATLKIVEGDFDTPEGKIGIFKQDRPWETCMPMTRADGGGGWSYRPHVKTTLFSECAKMLAACVTGCGNLLINIGPMPSGQIRLEELANLEAFGPWVQTYGESIYGVRGGPYINGEWGGAAIKGNYLYLHIFQWNGEGEVTLPPLPREVLDCRELGGEHVVCEQTKSFLKLKRSEGKAADVHSVVRLTLGDGPPIPLIAVEGDLKTLLSRRQLAPVEDLSMDTIASS
jgi:alpha-L-fucosidase